MDSEPSRIVEAGYDRMADRHLAWIDEIEGDPRLRFLDELLRRLPHHPTVLDLGCGAGVPCTARLAEVGDVVGVDVSASQLELARKRVPAGGFVKAEMTQVTFPKASFDAITAFYSIAHVPRDLHAGLLQRIATWLRPGGHFLASLGSGGSHDAVEDWLGVPMFFSSHDPQTNRQLIVDAGLVILVDENVTTQEPEGASTFQWVIAVKPEPERASVGREQPA